MIDERLYSIGPELQERLNWLKKHCYTEKATMETVIESNVRRYKAFYDIEAFARDGFENSPYNPDKQAYFMRVYDRDDSLTKEEFEKLRKIDQAKYVLYHQWKNGKVSIEQLKKVPWHEYRWPHL